MKKLAVVIAMVMSMEASAAPPTQPAPEQTRATRDSAFVRQLLREPMPSDATAAQDKALLFHFSGNAREAELLGKALSRAAVAHLMGETPGSAATIGEAIEREAAARPLVDAGKEAMARVVVTYPAGAVKVSVSSQPPSHSRVAVNLRATNGLRAPVTEFWAHAGSNDLSRGLGALPLLCKPPNAPAEIAAGATVDVACQGTRASDQIAPAVEALEARAPLPVNSLDTPAVAIMNSMPVIRDTAVATAEDRRRAQAAMQKLAALPCEQKGTCAAIAGEAQRGWRKRHGATVFAALAAAALALSALAALRRRPAVKESALGAAGSAAVVLFSMFGLATAGLGLVPGDVGYLAMVGFVVLYYGGLPFLAVLLALASTILTKATRARVFAVTFGALATALVAVTVLLG